MIDETNEPMEDLDTLDNNAHKGLLEYLHTDFRLIMSHMISVDAAGHLYGMHSFEV